MNSNMYFKIKTAEGLRQLAKLSQENDYIVGGNGIVALENDIDMGDYTDWSGIKDFYGTFNGNGHVISNLTGSQGLFANAKSQYTTIANVGLENLNITGNSQYVGGLVGYAENVSLIYNCYTTGSITNNYSGNINFYPGKDTVPKYDVGTGGLIGSTYTNSTSNNGRITTITKTYSEANVTARKSDGVGGLIGSAIVLYVSHQNKLDIRNSYAVGDVTGKDGVGGFIGTAHYDEDYPSDNTDIINCYSGGSANGNSKVGGFFGSFLYWGDRLDKSDINKCITTATVNGQNKNETGVFAGHICVKLQDTDGLNSTKANYVVNFTDCKYVPCGDLDLYGLATEENGNTSGVLDADGIEYDIKKLIKSNTTKTGMTEYQISGAIPSIASDGTGAYMSNILGVFTKAGLFDACDDTKESVSSVASMKTKIASFLGKFSDDNDGNTKLWYLNDEICKYLSDSTYQNTNFAQALFNDVKNGTTTNTASWQQGSARANITRDEGTSWTPDGTHSIIQGIVNIPSINTIADEIFYSMQKEYPSIEQENVRNWFNTKFSPLTQENKVTLANINEKINKKEDLTDIFNAINNNEYIVLNDYYYDETNPWEINVNTKDEQVYFPGQEGQSEEYWDTTDPAIVQAMAMWLLMQRGVIVVEKEQASDYKYLNNILDSGEAVLTTFNPVKFGSLIGKSAEEIMSISIYDYNELLEIENTSVAVEVTVQEVPDEKELKKAEAKYEADMLLIDKKERKYDTDLAALETERQACKEEIETLKNVAKDNVERTFKLFI